MDWSVLVGVDGASKLLKRIDVLPRDGSVGSILPETMVGEVFLNQQEDGSCKPPLSGSMARFQFGKVVDGLSRRFSSRNYLVGYWDGYGSYPDGVTEWPVFRIGRMGYYLAVVGSFDNIVSSLGDERRPFLATPSIVVDGDGHWVLWTDPEFEFSLVGYQKLLEESVGLDRKQRLLDLFIESTTR